MPSRLLTLVLKSIRAVYQQSLGELHYVEGVVWTIRPGTLVREKDGVACAVAALLSCAITLGVVFGIGAGLTVLAFGIGGGLGLVVLILWGFLPLLLGARRNLGSRFSLPERVLTDVAVQPFALQGHARRVLSRYLPPVGNPPLVAVCSEYVFQEVYAPLGFRLVEVLTDGQSAIRR